MLDNWIVQAVIGNVAWILFCKIFKYLYSYFKDLSKNSTNVASTKIYPKENLQKQFNISFMFSSICSITLVVILWNNLQYEHPLLTVSLILLVFLSYIVMFGAFGGIYDYFDK